MRHFWKAIPVFPFWQWVEREREQKRREIREREKEKEKERKWTQEKREREIEREREKERKKDENKEIHGVCTIYSNTKSYTKLFGCNLQPNSLRKWQTTWIGWTFHAIFVSFKYKTIKWKTFFLSITFKWEKKTPRFMTKNHSLLNLEQSFIFPSGILRLYSINSIKL